MYEMNSALNVNYNLVNGCFHKENEHDYLFFKVENLMFQDLYDWSQDVTRKRSGHVNNEKYDQQHSRWAVPQLEDDESYNTSVRSGRIASVNLTEVALFRHGLSVYALQESCPHAGTGKTFLVNCSHAGGPLHIGDIEECVGGRLCVRCPYHGWKFDLLSGECRWPGPQSKRKATVFPVRVERETGALWVGFTAFNERYFSEPQL